MYVANLSSYISMAIYFVLKRYLLIKILCARIRVHIICSIRVVSCAKTVLLADLN